MMEIKFRRDTSFRKALFSPDSFAHPAKMDAQLLLWLIEHYSKPGETILDPMAGSGTAMIGCTVGRNIVQVELEQKFVDMQKANWERIKMMPQLGHEMGECHIIQGDARQLGDILADHAIFSPPYALTGVGDWKTGRAEFQAWVLNELASKGYIEWQGKRYTESEWRAMNHGRIDGRTTKGVHKHPTDGYGDSEGQIGALPYGDIDSIVTSPPYAGDKGGEKGILANDNKDIFKGRSYIPSATHSDNPNNLGNLPYGSIDSVITIPPYEGIEARDRSKEASFREGQPGIPKRGDVNISKGYSVDSIVTSPPYEEGGGHGRGQRVDIVNEKHIYTKGAGMYSESKENIGEMRGPSYLSAMLQVYQQCHKVLKPGGLMIVVTKNFIRNKKEVRLDEDTIKLCEQAGFKFIERHYRKLPAQSFWRVIYQQKYPDAPVLDREDILVFKKTMELV